VDESAEAFGLTELLTRRNQELSSGQRTLVGIVMVFMALGLSFCGSMLRKYRQRGFVTRYS